MGKSKYEGRVYDAKWKVISHYGKLNHTIYVLENTYNGMQLKVNDLVMIKIDRGELTISKLMHIRTLREGNFDGRTIVFQKRTNYYQSL